MEWLTREQIDQVIEQMSAGDLIKSMESGSEGVGMPIRAFDSAAARLGISNGKPASDSVRMQDFKYLADAIGEAVNIDSPLSERQQD